MSAELTDLSTKKTYPLDISREDLLPKLLVGQNLSIPCGAQFFVLYGLRGYLLSRRIVILTDSQGKRWKIKFQSRVSERGETMAFRVIGGGHVWRVEVTLPKNEAEGRRWSKNETVIVVAYTPERAIATAREHYGDCAVWSVTHYASSSLSLLIAD